MAARRDSFNLAVNIVTYRVFCSAFSFKDRPTGRNRRCELSTERSNRVSYEVIKSPKAVGILAVQRGTALSVVYSIEWRLLPAAIFLLPTFPNENGGIALGTRVTDLAGSEFSQRFRMYVYYTHQYNYIILFGILNIKLHKTVNTPIQRHNKHSYQQ